MLISCYLAPTPNPSLTRTIKDATFQTDNLATQKGNPMKKLLTLFVHCCIMCSLITPSSAHAMNLTKAAAEPSAQNREECPDTFSALMHHVASAAATQDSAHSILANIQPFSATPFDHVPAYVYANPTQYKNSNWTPALFARIKCAANTATKAQIQSLAAASFKDSQPSSKVLAAKYTELAESYDWVHTMNLIEECLRDDRPLTINLIKEVNARLTRLTIATEGDFRTRNALWLQSQLSPTERLFWLYVQKDPNYADIFKALGNSSSIPFCETSRGLLDNKDRHLRVTDNKYISTDSIRELLSILDDRGCVITHDTHERLIIDRTLADQWETEECASAEHRKGHINIHTWIDKRTHRFPDARTIEVLLSDALNDINSNQLHPIEAAVSIWWNMAFIHPFNGAHKRTGKALASYLLLRCGYLPPCITNDQAQLYHQILKASLEAGPEVLLHFVVSLIGEAQKKYEGQTL